MQSALNKRASMRRKRVIHAISIKDESDTAVTKWELIHAIQHGKSTAPEIDGITYDILNCLTKVQWNARLTLFNMSYDSGELPGYKKEVTILPVPKPSELDSPWPIPLTSSYCKMITRIILKRLLFWKEDKLQDSLNGFIRRQKYYYLYYILFRYKKQNTLYFLILKVFLIKPADLL